MIFQYTLENVLNGTKTQTRRRIKPDTRFIYRVGKDYAVQPKRGAPAVARFQVTALREQPLGEMTHEEALAEGFGSVSDYHEQWRKQYGEFDPAEVVKVIEFRLISQDV